MTYQMKLKERQKIVETYIRDVANLQRVSEIYPKSEVRYVDIKYVFRKERR